MTSEWDESVDVLVVGSGFAGLAAAITAVQSGASTLVVEKMNSVGGNSKMSGGGVAAVGNLKQEAAGITDSVDLFTEDVLSAGGGKNDERLVRTIGEYSWPAVKWTIETLGVEYHEPLKQRGGHSVPRTYVATGGIGGYHIVKKAYDYLLDLGVEVRKECKLESIEMAAGGVEGVEVVEGYDFRHSDAGREYRSIRVDQGLVVATGGFGNDSDFLGEQNPEFEDMATTNHPGATGEVLQELLDIGARGVDLSYVQLLPTTSPEEENVGGTGLGNDFAIATVPHHIWIDPTTGRRFTNEAADRHSRAEAQLNLGNEPEYPLLLMDSTSEDVYVDPTTAVNKGVVYEFETLDRFAAHFDVPGERVREEIEHYNRFVERGHDDDFGKPVTYAEPLTDPPWYAMRVWPQVHYTMGGVAIDPDARVLDTDGAPIEGLYAAGEVTGGVHGKSRLTSNAITNGLVYGRIAGANAGSGPFPFE